MVPSIPPPKQELNGFLTTRGKTRCGQSPDLNPIKNLWIKLEKKIPGYETHKPNSITPLLSQGIAAMIACGRLS